MRKLSFGIVFLFLFQIGATAPESTASKPRASASRSPQSSQGTSAFSSMTTPQSVGNEIVKYLGKKTGKELMAEKTGKSSKKEEKTSSSQEPSKAKPAAERSGGAAVSSVAETAVTGGRSGTPNYVPAPPAILPAVPKIRQEIQRILDLNKRIRSVQGTRVKQIQQVRDQATVHQKILTDLERVQKSAGVQKIPSKSAIIGQEKLRVVHEKNKRNATPIAVMTQTPANTASGSPAVEKVKTAVS